MQNIESCNFDYHNKICYAFLEKNSEGFCDFQAQFCSRTEVEKVIQSQRSSDSLIPKWDQVIIIDLAKNKIIYEEKTIYEEKGLRQAMGNNIGFLKRKAGAFVDFIKLFFSSE